MRATRNVRNAGKPISLVAIHLDTDIRKPKQSNFDCQSWRAVSRLDSNCICCGYHYAALSLPHSPPRWLADDRGLRGACVRRIPSRTQYNNKQRAPAVIVHTFVAYTCAYVRTNTTNATRLYVRVFVCRARILLHRGVRRQQWYGDVSSQTGWGVSKTFRFCGLPRVGGKYFAFGARF